jgi:lipopolysaccharide export system protein LptA
MKDRGIFLVLCLTLGSGFKVHGYAQSEKLIIIENADSLIGRIVDGDEAKELIGNVRFSQENTHVSCDRAIQFKSSGNIQLQGNVVIIDSNLTMRFPRGMYYRAERRAVAYDSVQLDDGQTTLTARFGEYFAEESRAFFRIRVEAKDADSKLIADSLLYYRREERTTAMSRVAIESYADNMIIRGNRFESWRKQEYNRMTEGPVLVKFDTSGGKVETLVVRSKVMEAYRDSARRLRAIDSVEIVRAELAATCGFAEFFTRGDSIHLRNTPFVWYQRTQVTGDSINVYLKRRKLDIVDVHGNALAVSQSDSLRRSRFDQLTGETMQMKFGTDGLDYIAVNGRATSVYHLYEDSLANGLNKTSGDQIVMLWQHDVVTNKKKLSAIKVVGGVEGQYFPENLVYGKESEFALARFVWNEAKPEMRQTDFNPVAPPKKSGATILPSTTQGKKGKQPKEQAPGSRKSK